MKNPVRKDDKTTHGGVVKTASASFKIGGRRAALLGDIVTCPEHGDNPIVEHGEGYKEGGRKWAVEDFQGRIINADPTGRNLAFPTAMPPYTGCGNGDRGCNLGLLYSTDGGKTFSGMTYTEHSFKPFFDSKYFTVAVTRDKLYVAKKWGSDDDYVTEYPMVAGIDLDSPYPPGVTGDSFAASKRPGYLSGLRTPSGQDHITCDASIKPTNPDAVLR